MKSLQPAASVTRRRFLGTTAAAAAFTIAPRYILGGAGNVSPSEKINVAFEGCRMYGGYFECQ